MSKNLSARDAASVVLRLGLGIIFLVHGYQKVSQQWGTAWEKELGAFQPVVAWVELVCGATVLVGLLTRLSALALACEMLGAIYVVGQARGFMGGEMEGASSTFGYVQAGAEFPFAMFVQALAVMVLGGGTFSIDRLLPRGRRAAAQAAATGNTAIAAPHMDVAAEPAPAPAGTAPR